MQMALGARRSYVIGPLVVESLSLTALGGAIGVTFGVGAGQAARLRAGQGRQRRAQVHGPADVLLRRRPHHRPAARLHRFPGRLLPLAPRGEHPARGGAALRVEDRHESLRRQEKERPSTAQHAIIDMQGIRKVYDTGAIQVEALKGVDLKVERGRVRRHRRALRLGQVDAAQPGRLPRHADRRLLPAARRGSRRARRRRARRHPQPQGRLHLPELQPAAADHRLRERRAAAPVQGRRCARAAGARRSSCSSRSASPTA